MIKKIEAITEYVVKFTDEECAMLNIGVGDKFTVKVFDDGKIELIPFSTIEIDLDKWSREDLIFLIQQSCDRDVSVNNIISEFVKNFVGKEDEEGI